VAVSQKMRILDVRRGLKSVAMSSLRRISVNVWTTEDEKLSWTTVDGVLMLFDLDGLGI
jgi:hypothetical protein